MIGESKASDLLTEEKKRKRKRQGGDDDEEEDDEDDFVEVPEKSDYEEFAVESDPLLGRTTY